MSTLEQIVNHLEFLGYKIEKIDPTKEGEKIWGYARQSDRNTLAFLEMSPELILFKVSLVTKKQPSLEMDTFVNRFNMALNLSKFYYYVEDNNVVVRFEAIYTGGYLKEAFGQFYNLFEREQARLLSFENASKIFLNE